MTAMNVTKLSLGVKLSDELVCLIDSFRQQRTRKYPLDPSAKKRKQLEKRCLNSLQLLYRKLDHKLSALWAQYPKRRPKLRIMREHFSALPRAIAVEHSTELEWIPGVHEKPGDELLVIFERKREVPIHRPYEVIDLKICYDFMFKWISSQFRT